MFCATRIGRTLNKLRPSLLSTPELLKVPPAAISIIGNHRSTISSLRSIPSHNLRFSCFSTSAPVMVPRDEAEVPEGVPLIKNPPPEVVLQIFEERAAMCADKVRSQPLFGPSPTPQQYFTAIVRNTQIIGIYLRSVDFQEFRSGFVESDSPIARGREALTLYARVADQWLSNALAPSAGHEDPALAESMRFFRMNSKLIDIYEQGGPPPTPTWQDICDAIVIAFEYAYRPLDQAAGGVPEDFVIYQGCVTQGSENPEAGGESNGRA
ncbi:hypothetical protein AcV5_003738 [Taiwanofungus camphoratus]|nr:hypothetical protein AcV5_003738 [Antrodia cinnamomea]